MFNVPGNLLAGNGNLLSLRCKRHLIVGDDGRLLSVIFCFDQHVLVFGEIMGESSLQRVVY